MQQNLFPLVWFSSTPIDWLSNTTLSPPFCRQRKLYRPSDLPNYRPTNKRTIAYRRTWWISTFSWFVLYCRFISSRRETERLRRRCTRAFRYTSIASVVWREIDVCVGRISLRSMVVDSTTSKLMTDADAVGHSTSRCADIRVHAVCF